MVTWQKHLGWRQSYKTCICYARPLNQLLIQKKKKPTQIQNKNKKQNKEKKEGEEKTDKKKENDVFFQILKAGVSKMKVQAG